MKTIEKNLPELKALCDDQARRHLEMYKIMKSCYQIMEEMQQHQSDCVRVETGAGYIIKNLIEYVELLDNATIECELISNLK